MELRQIKYFIEVAKREHVTKAANALHIAQSAVSRQIFNLERELGVDLFIREGRSVKLTAVGKVFLEHMEQVMHVLEDAKQVVNEYTDPEQGTVHIGFPSSIAKHVMPAAISSFRKKYPHVKFNLYEERNIALKKAVQKGEVNIALLAPLPKSSVHFEGSILFTERIFSLLPINHPRAHEEALKLSDLREDSFILYPHQFTLRKIIEENCQKFGFQPKVALESAHIETIKGLVSEGLGISLLPEMTLIDRLPRSTVAIPITEPNFTRTVGVITPVNRKLLPTEELFYHFLKDFFARLENFQN